MKNIKVKIISIFTGLVFLFSCEFGDTNVNPALPGDVSAQAIVPAAQAAMAFAIGGEMVRISGLFMQQFQGINAQQFDNYQYLVKSSDMDGVWRRMYKNTINPTVTILRKAEAEDSKHTVGMAKVMIAHSIGSLADMFGDVPYSDAFQALDGNFFPAYDTQEEVYGRIQTLLDEAIVLLEGDAGGGPSLGGDDLMFGGNVATWAKIARSLKAKYFIHTSKVNANAYTDALAALENGISSNAEDFQFLFGFGPNEANPQYQFTQDRGGNIAIDPFFFNLLTTRDDPRSGNFLSLVDANDPGQGFNTNFNSGTFYTQINSPVIYMSFAESKFIEAEAELMGNNDVAAAEAALVEAVEASIAKITGGTDVDYVDTNASFDGLTTNEERLEVIMTEKYIALYSHGLESWTDFRRTGYPNITPNPQGSNAFNLNGEVPRRLPYPQTEIDLNPSNVPTNSPDFQDRFWWDN